jgi:hypothetical protein
MARIDDLSESHATLWGTEAQFTVTRVERDRQGWDRLFEFAAPRPHEEGPFSLGVMDFTAKVQVKATRTDDNCVSVTLSNWKRAIEDPLPWFFLFIRFDEDTVQAVALVHVDAAQVERALSSIFRLPLEERSRLHKHTMDVCWTADDILAKPLGLTLRARVYEAVGSNPFAYANQKRTWYETLGAMSVVVTVQVQADTREELHRRLARAAVGLENELEVTNFIVTRTRFGIEETETPIPKARLAIGPPTEARRTTVILSRADGQGSVTFSATVRSSLSIFPELPKEYAIFRFQLPYLDLLLEGGSRLILLPLLPRSDEECSIQELATVFSVLQLLHEANDVPIEFHLCVDNTTQRIGHTGSVVTLSPDLLRVTRDVRAFAVLAGRLGANLDAKASLNSLTQARPVVQIMQGARDRTSVHVRAETTLTPGVFTPEYPTALLTNPMMRIGNLTYVDIVVTSPAQAEILLENANEVRIRLQSSEVEHLKSFQVSDGQSLDWQRELELAATMLDQSHNIVLVPWDQLLGRTPA